MGNPLRQLPMLQGTGIVRALHQAEMHRPDSSVAHDFILTRALLSFTFHCPLTWFHSTLACPGTQLIN